MRLAAAGAGVMIGLAIGAGLMWFLGPAPPGIPIAHPSLDVLPADGLSAGGARASYPPTAGGSRTALVWAPDGQALVFVGRRGGVQRLYVRRLDAAEARPLAGTEGAQVPAISPDGRWVAFWAANAIKRMPFGGGPITNLVSGVGWPPFGLAWDGLGRLYFGREDGRIWQIPPDGAPVAVTVLGEAERAHVLPWPLPDGRRIAVTIASLTERGLWLYDVGRGTLAPLTGGGEASWPVWTPDGRHLASLRLSDGRSSLAMQPADGTAPPQDLLERALTPSSWTPDGRHLVAMQGGDIVAVTAEGGRVGERAVLETREVEFDAEISPDGRWLAYRSFLAGQAEVYVRPYPGPGPAEQVSIAGGVNPAWNPTGGELFFLSLPSAAGRRSMMAVEFKSGASPRIGRPRALFESDPADLFAAGATGRLYDVARDGQRFYLVQEQTPQSPPPVTHISLMPGFVNLVKEKVPAR